MTEIRFEDVQVGDRVRVTRERSGIVTKIDPFRDEFHSDDGWPWSWLPGDTIELLDRPIPPARCGDIREDPETGARYWRTDEDVSFRTHWVAIKDPSGEYIGLRPDRAAAIIARLRPVTP